MRGAGWVEACQITGWHVEMNCGSWVQWGGRGQTKGHNRSATLWAMFVMPSLPMARASVAAGRWWTWGCILHWLVLTWGRSVEAGGSRGGASVPGGWRSEKPTTWTHAARPSCYLRLSTGLQWKGERGQANCEEGGSVTDPGMRLSSGCFVGPELIEGES